MSEKRKDRFLMYTLLFSALLVICFVLGGTATVLLSKEPEFNITKLFNAIFSGDATLPSLGIFGVIFLIAILSIKPNKDKSMKGKDKLVLVTDSAEQKDDPDMVEFGKEGAFRLPDGTLFGSALYINKGVDNLHRKARLPLVTTINAATINPAKYLGVDDRKGSIEVGKDADLVVCNETIELEQVYCFGKKQLG